MSQTSSPTGVSPNPVQPRPAPAACQALRGSIGCWDAIDAHGSATGEQLELIRCSRCQRALSWGLEPAQSHQAVSPVHSSPTGSGMVRFGHNLYYCARCASMVGLKR